MNILDKIIEKKKAEIAFAKSVCPVKDLEKILERHAYKNLSLKNSLNKNEFGIIAEFKRKSPSKGILNNKAKLPDVTDGYVKHGAAGISILTDKDFFGGSVDDFRNVSASKRVPLLRKDFIIDEYQVYETKALGADVILLIAACLSKKQVKQLASIAKNLELEILLEIHNEDELEHICSEVDIVGINNRNLKTFEVDINTSLRLINKVPDDKAAISESGISNADTILALKKAGFKGFLIGEHFMKEPNPLIAFAEFVNRLKAKKDAR